MKISTPLLLFLSTLLPLSAQSKKNILFIAIDDLKPNIGAYGDAVAKTPNIDRLAARGLLFERTYTNQALCSPSRNSLLTGVRPSSLGIYDLATNFRKAAPNAISLPQHFVSNGYRAESIGKIYHVGHGNGDDEKSWSVPAVRPPAPTYALPENQAPAGQGKPSAKGRQQQRGATYESADVPDDTYADGKIAAETISRLEAAKGRSDTPFFIAAGFHRPHLPFVAPKKYWDLYDPASLKLPDLRKAPEGAPEIALRKNSELASYKDTKNSDALTDPEQIKLLHGYYAAVSYTDAQIGKLLDTLDRLGLTENTIIVLWGDHGWHLGDHGLWAKMTNFEQATRIPFIVSAPGVTTAGTKTKALAQSIDIYPTLVELAGLPKPSTTPSLEGESLVPVLKNPKSKVHEEVLQVLPRGQGIIGRSIRSDSYRLVEWKKPGAAADTAEFELYDYDKDPTEIKNHAKEQPEIVEKLKARLATFPEAKPQLAAAETTAAPSQDRAKLFANRDKDQDGKLTREEFLTNQKNANTAEKRFVNFDTNKDSSLSKEEFISAGQ